MIKGIDIIFENEQIKNIKVEPEKIGHKFVLWSIENGLSGIENFSTNSQEISELLLMQNIGAYGVEVKMSLIKYGLLI